MPGQIDPLSGTGADLLPKAAREGGGQVEAAGGPDGQAIGDAGAERRADIPLPRNPQAILLACILGLLVLAALYVVRPIAIPILFATILYFALQPLMRWLTRWHVPQVIAGLLVLVGFLACLAGLAMSLSAPAADWVARAPQSLPRIEDRLYFLKEQLARLQDALHQVERLGEGFGSAPAVVVAGPGLSSSLFTGTTSTLAALGTMAVVLFFLLVSGDQMLRRLVEIVPRLSNKKQAVEIAHEIETQVSAYLGTIGLINAAVGLATGIAAYACGLPDAVLWGTLAFLLNFVPILGPLCGIVLLFMIGLLTFDQLWRAALPAGIYLLIHVMEGELITPMLLARRFVLNPVLVVLSLIFWFWMWGIAGALVSVPMLAILKIVCDRVRPLMAIGHFLGGAARD
ncbi:MAG TPA: AI-2E family transporter [Dongiaceae bacterium]|nr:AI-2E family transporter [Dongiaceae bacterium]